MEVPLTHYDCKRCGYRWIPRKTDVRQCPHCKSAYWETPRPAEDIQRTDEPVLDPTAQAAVDAKQDLRNETRLRDKDRAGLL